MCIVCIYCVKWPFLDMRNKNNCVILNLNIHVHLILEKKFKQKRGAEKTNKNCNCDNSYNGRMEIQKHRTENRNSEVHWKKELISRNKTFWRKTQVKIFNFHTNSEIKKKKLYRKLLSVTAILKILLKS